MRCFFRFCCSLLAFLMTGCVCALHPANATSRQTFQFLPPAPEHYTVRVGDGQSYPVASDGRVSFEVPPLQSGCAVYLFGLVKVADHQSEDVPAIQVFRDGRLVRRLSLNQISKLPTGPDHSHVLKLR
jgi:hypothetical protein